MPNSLSRASAIKRTHQADNKPSKAIESFLSNCEASLISTSSSTSVSDSFTIQQEIGYYISSIDKETDFE